MEKRPPADSPGPPADEPGPLTRLCLAQRLERQPEAELVVARAPETMLPEPPSGISEISLLSITWPIVALPVSITGRSATTRTSDVLVDVGSRRASR